MNISVMDGSSYFKGLLLLIRKDGKVTEMERELMTRIGKNLGFESGFVENAIHEILDNRFITVTPPEFSTRELAEKFLRDGLTLAFSDRELHPGEEKWLLSVAKCNNIDLKWLGEEKEKIMTGPSGNEQLEADSLKVIY